MTPRHRDDSANHPYGTPPTGTPSVVIGGERLVRAGCLLLDPVFVPRADSVVAPDGGSPVAAPRLGDGRGPQPRYPCNRGALATSG